MTTAGRATAVWSRRAGREWSSCWGWQRWVTWMAGGRGGAASWWLQAPPAWQGLDCKPRTRPSGRRQEHS